MGGACHMMISASGLRPPTTTKTIGNGLTGPFQSWEEERSSAANDSIQCSISKTPSAPNRKPKVKTTIRKLKHDRSGSYSEFVKWFSHFMGVKACFAGDSPRRQAGPCPCGWQTACSTFRTCKVPRIRPRCRRLYAPERSRWRILEVSGSSGTGFHRSPGLFDLQRNARSTDRCAGFVRSRPINIFVRPLGFSWAADMRCGM